MAYLALGPKIIYKPKGGCTQYAFLSDFVLFFGRMHFRKKIFIRLDIYIVLHDGGYLVMRTFSFDDKNLFVCFRAPKRIRFWCVLCEHRI